MIVLAVATILLLIALPSFADMVDRARVRGAAAAAVSMVANARAISVQRNRDVMVKFAGTDPAWCMGANSAADPTTLGDKVQPVAECDCTTPSSCITDPSGTNPLVVDSSNYSGVTMGTRPANVTFGNLFGTMNPLASTCVIFTSPRGKYQVQMSIAPLGQASLCVPSGQPTIQGISTCPGTCT